MLVGIRALLHSSPHEQFEMLDPARRIRTLLLHTLLHTTSCDIDKVYAAASVYPFAMSSLLALLSQQTPNLQTQKGLILLGLQNDFLSPDGKLPVSPRSGYLERLKELVPAFREFGSVIWVRSEFEANRVANPDDGDGDTVIAGSTVDGSLGLKHVSKRKASEDATLPLKRAKPADAEEEEEDPELFLNRTSNREPCCVKASWGAEYPEDIQNLIADSDIQVTKTYYSAFGSTSLLLTLRSKLITELFVCGCNTNLSVFATAMDAARYGIQITLIEDCLGYRRRERHDEAIRKLVDIMESDVMSSSKTIDMLRSPPDDDKREDHCSDEDEESAAATDELEADSSEEEEEEDFIPDPDAHIEKQHWPPSARLPLNVENLRSLSLRRSTAVAARSTVTSQAVDLEEKTAETTVDEYEKAMHEARDRVARYDALAQRSTPLFGMNKEKESAGSRILYDLLPAELAETVFEKLKPEVHWQPAEEAAGHALNHVLIQLYRGGTDFISEHSDKTLDIAKGSSIVNVSFGAQRTMRLRSKRGATSHLAAPSKHGAATSPLTRTTHRIPLPHNSMITMSLETNAEYLHGINADKRPAVEFSAAEKEYDGQRISLTFRQIETFLSADERLIWGQGATGKSRALAREVVNGDGKESEELVRAFGAENKASRIEWEVVYGRGSDVLHLK
ncbi:hypothetical protein B0A50_02471 [Salinomyces thailandicus]|uniref:Fe2OG dioxygenase domain-containing protein n=1 Tax=Salinomyces thailandicus TaxID=706561 RepID=A0A4U0U6D2_9PEZI|nr:hypothetical protein B0A50_02471 [Salinomyces thailandica]